MRIKLCKKCVLTNTRPNVIFDKYGVCSVCNYFELKEKKINWKKQKKNLKGY